MKSTNKEMTIESNHFEKYIVIYNQSNQTELIENMHDPGDGVSNHTRDIVLLGILAIFIILINGLITISFMLNKNLRKRPANLMICSQACTDLFTGTVFVPCYLIKTQSAHILTLFLSCYMLYLSLFNLLVISIDRYLALSRPFIHRKLIDVSRTRRLIIIVWVAPLGVILIPLFWWFSSMEVKLKAQNIYVCTIWIIMLILVVSMTILYVFATRRAKRTIRNRRASCGNRAKAKAAMLARKELRVVHLFGLLLFFFVAAYLPILYINFVEIIGFDKYAPLALHVIGLYLLIFNSIVNPILCIMLKKDYLQAIKKLFLFKQKSEDLWSLSSQYGSQYGSRTTIQGSKRSMGNGSHRKKSQPDYNYSAKTASNERKLLQSSSPEEKTFLNSSSPGGRNSLPINSPEIKKFLNSNCSPEKKSCLKSSSPDERTFLSSSSPEGRISTQSNSSVERKSLQSKSPEKRTFLHSPSNEENSDIKSLARRSTLRRKFPEKKPFLQQTSLPEDSSTRSPRDRNSFLLSSSPEGRISLESHFTFDKKYSFNSSPTENTYFQTSSPERRTLLQRLSSTEPPTFLHGNSPAERKFIQDSNNNHNNSHEKNRRTGVHSPIERGALQRNSPSENVKVEMLQLIENVV